MPAPRSKPFLAWEPLPFLVLFVLVVIVSLARPDTAPWAFWPVLVVVIVAAVWLVNSMVRSGRAANPDRWGELSSLEGVDLVDAPAVDRAVRSVVPVVDTARHQPAIELARLFGGTEQPAVLVPRSSRWMSRRYRIGVALVGGDRPRHAGFLGGAADDRWRDLLDAEREHGRYLRVPALIVGDTKPYSVELDLSGLAHREAEH
jgi:hypothetical protein